MSEIQQFINNLKKNIAFIIAMCLIFTSVIPVVAHASEEQLEEFEEILIEELSEELSEENIEIERVDISLDEIVVEVSTENVDGEEVLTMLEFAPGATEITLITRDYEEGVIEEREFVIDLSEMEDYIGTDTEAIEFVIEDVNTGEVFEIDTEEGVLSSFAFVIAAVGIKIGVGAFLSLLALGKFVIIFGKIWKVLCPQRPCRPIVICPPELPLCFPSTTTSNYNHFEAMMYDGNIVIGEGLNLTSASNRLSNGEDTWSTTANHARSVARGAANRMPSAILNNARPNGRRSNLYMNHILPNPRTGGHAYFGLTVRRGVR